MTGASRPGEMGIFAAPPFRSSHTRVDAPISGSIYTFWWFLPSFFRMAAFCLLSLSIWRGQATSKTLKGSHYSTRIQSSFF
ncbi:hypothetical protein BDW68DRAFT_151666 [Aspergillus falconensis]